jgi:hypothetical protein
MSVKENGSKITRQRKDNIIGPVNVLGTTSRRKRNKEWMEYVSTTICKNKND